MEDKKIVVALGGNAIIAAGQKGTIAEQFENTRLSLGGIIKLIKDGYKMVVTHGNGPQAGAMLLRVEAGLTRNLADRPLGVIVADTQGGMGYMIEQSLQNRLIDEGINKDVVTILSQIVVDKNDPQMQDPSKPVGPFYSKEDAKKMEEEKNWLMVEDSGRGWRRVVPSPIPQTVVEKKVIKTLVENGNIVIAGGGGGIPVYVKDDGTYEGVDGVVDKDFATAVIAKEIGAKTLVISTGVEKVAINFGKPDQKELSKITVDECQKHFDDGQFPKGSMGPKILAAISFIKQGGDKVYITSPNKIADALEGKTGTLITK